MKYILIHGLGQTPASWEPVLDALGPLREDCLCPGLAALAAGQPLSYPILYEAFCRFCDAVNQPLALCGLSLGGVLALDYAASHPGRVAALTLISAQYKMPRRLLQFQNAVFRLMPRSAFAQMGFGKPDVIRLCRTMAELDFSTRLGGVTCPALVLCGARDSANRAAALALAKGLPRATLRFVPGAGHELNRDAPAMLGRMLRKQMEDVKS